MESDHLTAVSIDVPEFEVEESRRSTTRKLTAGLVLAFVIGVAMFIMISTSFQSDDAAHDIHNGIDAPFTFLSARRRYSVPLDPTGCNCFVCNTNTPGPWGWGTWCGPPTTTNNNEQSGSACGPPSTFAGGGRRRRQSTNPSSCYTEPIYTSCDCGNHAGAIAPTPPPTINFGAILTVDKTPGAQQCASTKRWYACANTDCTLDIPCSDDAWLSRCACPINSAELLTAQAATQADTVMAGVSHQPGRPNNSPPTHSPTTGSPTFTPTPNPTPGPTFRPLPPTNRPTPQPTIKPTWATNWNTAAPTPPPTPPVVTKCTTNLRADETYNGDTTMFFAKVGAVFANAHVRHWAPPITEGNLANLAPPSRMNLGDFHFVDSKFCFNNLGKIVLSTSITVPKFNLNFQAGVTWTAKTTILQGETAQTFSHSVLGHTVSVSDVHVFGNITNGELECVKVNGEVDVGQLPPLDASIAYCPHKPAGKQLTMCATLANSNLISISDMLHTMRTSLNFLPGPLLDPIEKISFKTPTICEAAGMVKITGISSMFGETAPFTINFLKNPTGGFDLAGIMQLPQFSFKKLGAKIPAILPVADFLDLVFKDIAGARFTFATMDMTLPHIPLPAFANLKIPHIGHPSLSAVQLKAFNLIPKGGQVQFAVNLNSGVLKVVSHWTGIDYAAVTAKWGSGKVTINANFLGYKRLTSFLYIGDKATNSLFGLSFTKTAIGEEISLVGFATLFPQSANLNLRFSASIGTRITVSLQMTDAWESAFGIHALTILPSGFKLGISTDDFLPTTFNLVTGIKVGKFQGKIGVIMPNIQEGQVCFQASLENLYLGDIIETIIPALKFPTIVLDFLNLEGIKEAFIYFSESPLHTSFMGTTCNGAGFKLSLDWTLGPMAANLEIDIMPVKGFFLKGDIKALKLGIIDITRDTSLPPIMVNGKPIEGPYLSMHVDTTNPGKDSFSIDGEMKLFGLMGIGIKAIMSPSELMFSCTINLAIIEFFAQFTVVGGIKAPTAITFLGEFTSGGISKLGKELVKEVKKLAKDFVKDIVHVRRRLLTVEDPDPEDEFNLVLSDPMSAVQKNQHAGVKSPNNRRLTGFIKHLAHKIGHGIKSGIDDVGHLAEDIGKDAVKAADEVKNIADVVAKALEKIAKIISSVRIKEIKVSGDVDLLGFHDSVTFDIVLLAMGKTFNFSLGVSVPFNPIDIIDDLVDKVKGIIKGLF